MNTAIALGGAALVAGALASTYAVLRISTRPVIGQALTPDVATALLVASALLLLGLPALYAVQAQASGVRTRTLVLMVVVRFVRTAD